MFKLKFKNNKRLLGAMFLLRDADNPEKQELLKHFKQEHYVAFNNLKARGIEYLNDVGFEWLFEELFETAEFKKYVKETYAYQEKLFEEFLEDYTVFRRYYKRVLKTDSTKEIDMYVIHPKAKGGLTLLQKDGEKKDCFIWGHEKGLNDKAYNLTYYMHESLHCLYPYKGDGKQNKNFFTKDDYSITHSFIELATDNEFYTRQSGESKYLKDNKFYGHGFLQEHKQVLIPYWFEYLGLDQDQIKERVGDMKLTTPLKDFDANNFDNLLKYCHKNIKEIKANYDNQLENINE